MYGNTTVCCHVVVPQICNLYCHGIIVPRKKELLLSQHNGLIHHDILISQNNMWPSQRNDFNTTQHCLATRSIVFLHAPFAQELSVTPPVFLVKEIMCYLFAITSCDILVLEL